MHYLLGVLALLTLWVLIFIWQKNLRREMLTASLIVAPTALSEPFFVPNYWSPDAIFGPKLSIEDFIFSFTIGGFTAVVYELFMGGKLKHKRLCACFNGEILHGFILMIGVAGIFLSYFLLRINFMYAVYLGIAIDIFLIVFTRPDLLKKVLYSGLIFGLVYFLFFSLFSLLIPGFIKHWNLAHLSGIFVLGVPLEEILWALGAGGLLGPIYEYLLSIKLIERR
ncbi:MAG: lycopene cyclase domain-containing protein [Candidatus Levybacteria bacterium]|nr:lycopene cyclase domain-containing protein [Candidatus Levybacteria bacterium]